MSGQQRPKAGDRVRVLPLDGRPSLIGKTGTVIMDDGSVAPFKCVIDGEDRKRWFCVGDLEVLHASEPSPRQPWEYWRDASALLHSLGLSAGAGALSREADRLESAAKPKPPTLAEAVQEFFAFNGSSGVFDARKMLDAEKAIREALKREQSA